MHKHFCELAGRERDCNENCRCICGLPMEGRHHSNCAVELRPCAEHKHQAEQRIAEAPFLDSDTAFEDVYSPNVAVPHCNCGCATAGRANVVGWCLCCDHGYADCNPELEDLHFANDCFGAPSELKEAARARRS